MSTQTLPPPASATDPNRSAILASPGSPEFFRDPYPTYRALREKAPLVSLRPNVLACTRYEDCLALLRDPHLSARRYMRPIEHYTEEQRRELATWIRVVSNQVIFADPPDHTRLRSAMAGA